MLIAAGADFLADRYFNTDVIMLTNTDEISLSYSSKEELADKIIDMFTSGTRRHFVDLENKSRLYYNSEIHYGKRGSGIHPAQAGLDSHVSLPLNI